jgi:phage tail-like protein
MSTDVGALLYQSLPGLYRDKDTGDQLRAFLEIAALPLAEIEASIDQLHQDLYAATSRDAFIGLIGALVGMDVDAGLPTRARRAQVLDAIRFYRAKGMHDPVLAFAESLTGWRVELVDYSERVAQVAFVTGLNPVVLVRDQAVTVHQPVPGSFFFRPGREPKSLFDARAGRPITRAALAADPAAYAGVEGGFSVSERGADLFGADPPYQAVAADLTRFDQPRTPTGAPLTVGSRQVAVDPQLARLRIGAPPPLAVELTVTFHSLEPEAVPPQTIDLGDPPPLAVLGRASDRAPTTVDFRAPQRVTEPIGRQHFDNLGFHCTPAVVVTNRRPRPLPATAGFSFDDRPLAPGDATGLPLQLLDGLDGSPLTRRKLRGHERDYCGTPRGFTIRIRGRDVTDPGFEPAVRILSADLENLDQPRDPDGGALALGPADIAVDPQLGRFRLDLAGLGATAEDIQVDYLLGLATRLAGTPLTPLTSALWSVSADGRAVRLVDGLDGTPVAAALRLSAKPGRYHGTARGWVVSRNGLDVTASLAAHLVDLDDPGTPVPLGRLAIDPDRGRVKFPPNLAIDPDDRIVADLFVEDTEQVAQVFASLAQRLPRVVPAGVVPVLVDTRTPIRRKL